MDARVITPDGSQTLRLYDVGFTWGIGAAETDGRISILEVSIPPRTLVKPHAHTNEDEFSYVLAGPIGVRVGDAVTETVPTGSWLIKPRSVPHALWNVGEQPARILEVVTPGGLEGYFQKIAPIHHGARPRMDEALRRGRRGVRTGDPERLVQRAPGDIRHHALTGVPRLGLTGRPNGAAWHHLVPLRCAGPPVAPRVFPERVFAALGVQPRAATRRREPLTWTAMGTCGSARGGRERSLTG